MNAMVSILVPCYNAERWIAAAIESALAQTWPDKEVIVVDDGSTDRSVEIIKGFGARIRWETGPNRGGNAARNRLLDLARGAWLQYLDADDYLLPDKIEQQMRFLAGRDDIDILFGPAILEHWREGRISGTHRLEIPRPHDNWVLLARWFLPQTGASLWRKSAIVDVGGWDPKQPCCQEHELYLRLLMAGKSLVYSDASGAVYRQWSEQTVCKRDKPETRRRRMVIEERAERHLRATGKLTQERLTAINQARFELARATWQHDRAEASAMMDTIRRSQPSFRPSGDAAPLHYQVLFGLLGFRVTERLAEIARGRPKDGARA